MGMAALMRLSLIVSIVLLVTPVLACESSIDGDTINYDRLIAQNSKLPDDLTLEQQRLAEQLYQRIYSLYRPEYYQKTIDEIRQGIQPRGSETISLSVQRKLSCFNTLSTFENYQKMQKYFAERYVADHSIDEVEQTLTLLNYFFIDDLAKAVVQANNSNLEASFHQQLKAQGLESTYKAFINPYPFLNETTNESSLDYFDIKSLAGLDIFRTNEQLTQASESESYIDPNPYPNLMWTFIMSNIEACDKLGSDSLSQD